MHKLVGLLSQLVQLSGPAVQGVFVGLPTPALNGSLWSIAYEFRCYIAVAIVGALGGFNPRRRVILLAGVVTLLCWNASGMLHGKRMHLEYIFGRAEYLIKLLGIFGVGSLFYLYIPAQKFSGKIAAIALPILIVLMFNRFTAEAAWAICGGYIIFWLAFRARPLASDFTAKYDLSYGIYLYAWPIQSMLIWFVHIYDPLELTAISAFLASAAAFCRWVFIERPALRLAHHRAPPDGRRQPA